MCDHEQDEVFEHNEIEQGYNPAQTSILFGDITGFVALVHSCFESVTASVRKAQIEKILSSSDWHEHHVDNKTKRRVLAHSKVLEHKHERTTAILLTQVNYDVIFVPQAMFKRTEKRYDVLLLRDTIILKADLKCIYSKNPDTIGNRIKEGSDQASRVVLHICSDISAKVLIEGLKTGSTKNDLLNEILLFYKNKFHRLPKNLILSKQIFEVLK